MKATNYMVRLLILFLFAGLLSACGNEATQTHEEQSAEAVETDIVTLDAAQLEQTAITLAKAETISLSKRIRVNGLIDVPPQNLVSVSMPMGGYLKSTKLLPGMHFNKGEVIAVMEDVKYVELQQDYLIAVSRYKMLEQEYERQKELNASRAGSDKNFQQAAAAWESASITLQSLAEKLRLLGMDPDKVKQDNITRSIPIRAPINGFVSSVNVNIGKYVNPTDVLFELVNPDDIHLSLDVFENDMEDLFLGQEVIAYTNSHPERKYPCEVILIGKNVSEKRSVNIHCHFEQYDKTLVPGTYMNAELIGPARKVTVLPDEAVIHDGKEHYVFLQTGKGTFRKLKAETGISQNGKTEILNVAGTDLKQSQFVATGAYTLWMKMNNVEEEE